MIKSDIFRVITSQRIRATHADYLWNDCDLHAYVRSLRGTEDACDEQTHERESRSIRIGNKIIDGPNPFMPTTERHVQRAIIYANIRHDAFYPLCSTRERRGDEKKKTRAGIFIAKDAAHVLLDRRRSQSHRLRIPVKSIRGQTVDGITEIRWVIVLRVCTGHWIRVAPAHITFARWNSFKWDSLKREA